MTVTNPVPIAIAEESIPNAPNRARRRVVRGSRPGWFVYTSLAIVLGAAIFPFYWSFLIGSGDASTIRDPDMSWLPGGNFLANAASVVNDPAVNFWRARCNE